MELEASGIKSEVTERIQLSKCSGLLLLDYLGCVCQERKLGEFGVVYELARFMFDVSVPNSGMLH